MKTNVIFKNDAMIVCDEVNVYEHCTFLYKRNVTDSIRIELMNFCLLLGWTITERPNNSIRITVPTSEVDHFATVRE